MEMQSSKPPHRNNSHTSYDSVEPAVCTIKPELDCKDSSPEVAVDVEAHSLSDGKDGNRNETDSSSLCCAYRLNFLFRRFLAQNWLRIKWTILIVLLLAYIAYFAYSMYYEFGGEPSARLLVGTIIGVLVLVTRGVRRLVKCPCALPCGSSEDKELGRRRQLVAKVVRWGLYIMSIAGAVVIIGVDVVRKRPENLICLVGLLLLIVFSFFISRQPDKINWHAVFWGMGLQFWFAVLIRKTTFGSEAFQWLADRIVEFLKYTDKGSEATFGASFRDHKFVFQLMPTLIFMNAIISVLYYLGLVQIFIANLGKFLSFCLGTSPIECVNAASNLFLTLSEAPILIKPFLTDITMSELFAVMTGGFASIAGSLLGAFAGFGVPANHILTASVMSAPAALAFAKLIYPDERKPTVKAEDAYKVDVRHYGSLLGALSKGAKDGLTMVGYVVISLLVYVAVLEFLDQTMQWFAARAGVDDLTFSKLTGYVFYPLTYMMGFETVDCLAAAKLLGVKIFTTTTAVFKELGHIITNGKDLQEYIDTYNGTWTSVGDDIFLEATNTTLVGGVLTERSGILATYMVCGLSNLGAIGVAIGAFTSLVPARSTDIYRMVPLALLAGNMASFSTACVSGLLLTD